MYELLSLSLRQQQSTWWNEAFPAGLSTFVALLLMEAPLLLWHTAALVNLTRNNAAELASKGIRVNGINMGWCMTENENKLQKKQSDENWIVRADESVPLGRILRPEDVASSVVFLLSHASAMMTGSVLELHPEFPHGMLSVLDNDSR
mmetsp:Transcript_46489/g.86376  ORF Transcript_46489/g.86376 Transcript_46489/m.86376 type:complete len:148 (+) Transcript_46489:259-702(+)